MNDTEEETAGVLPAWHRGGNHRAIDPQITLMIPEKDTEDPVLSIIIPALNEESVISEFMDWANEGIAKAGVSAEVMIVDSSSDRTPEIALAKGARVLKTPVRGLGRAYQDALGHARGRYILMGDADCTYDFREIEPFMRRFEEGYDFVMGSRFKGTIEAGAMPALHRYFDTPLTTFILNFLYGSRFSDIHCGMRGVTREGLERIDIQSQSWEYASEMVVKSVRLGLKTVEVPVLFYKDRHGRVSHHKRMGWFSPWHAGWINLRAMLIHGADYFVVKPGWMALAIGVALMAVLAFGPVEVQGVTLSLNTMLLALMASSLGLGCLCLGAVARSIYDRGGGMHDRWRDRLPYTRTALSSFAVFTVGILLVGLFVSEYVDAGYAVTSAVLPYNHLAIWGLFLITGSFLVFVSTLMIHALGAYAGSGRALPDKGET